MLELDGSAGGGQLVRTALTCSVRTGEPFELDDVRGARSNPGLRPQHLAAVDLAAAIADADVEGANAGSDRLVFEPGEPTPGEYAVDVGTAGSVTLVFDVALPLAVGLDGPLRVDATGGTDVNWSPPLDWYRGVKLPLLRRFGVHAAVDADRRGFYPAGGGTATLSVTVQNPAPLRLEARGARECARVFATVTTDLQDAAVGRRLADSAREELEADGWSVRERVVGTVDAPSTGALVVLRLDYDDSLAGVSARGEPGKPAEEVAAEAVDRSGEFDESDAAVDAHLADQLLVFLAFVGGRVRAPRVTDHVRSNADLLRAFGFDVRVEEEADGSVVLAGCGPG